VHRTKTFYTISPSLFPRPEYWPDHLYVTGFIERDKTLDWEPQDGLLNFLSRHKKLLLITFGSMKNNDPLTKTRVFLKVLENQRIPAIINTSWGGLQKIENPPEHIFFVDNIPYDWILPKIYAIVHHGGSGTTHTACKYGCPSLIIPHIVDQYFWNRRIADLGLGPLGVPVKKLTARSLEGPLKDLWNNPGYKQTAVKVARQMRSEGSPRDLMRIIQIGISV
jgi:UDP:flavonoid glycosyltransferase YjiC (YdhE family)